jgi:enterochelin esterase family protein
MKKSFLLFLLLGFLVRLPGQTFQKFIEHVNGLPEGERQAVVDSFMNAGHSFPYCEYDTLVHFIYRGGQTTVSLAGDATGWNPNVPLVRISGTDFWYHTAIYESDARLDYKYVLNGSSWILDPLNPHICTGGFGPNSELNMPGYIVPPEIHYYTSIPHGVIRDTVFHSTQLNNSRTIKVYLPSDYDTSGKTYPVVLFHDGLEYLSLCSAKNILDYLIAHQMMAPVIGIFVPPVDRTQEYAGNKQEKFRKFIIEELMPVMEMKYRIDSSSQKRAMIGASNGGNISLYIGMNNPEQFGKIGVQSSNVQSSISQSFQNNDKMNLELYLDIGTYDLPSLIPLVKNFVSILQSKQYPFQFFEFHEGHSWGNWKGHLRLPLMQFFPFHTGLQDPVKKPPCQLKQNYPNPFQEATIIPFFLETDSPAELFLIDISGKRQMTLFSGKGTAGENLILFHNRDIHPGIYFYTLWVDKTAVTKSMMIQ